MKRSYVKHTANHMCISVDGVLQNYKRKKINFCQNDDGTQMTDFDARLIFRNAKKEGKRVLPMSDECYRFCFQKGCKGHIKSLMPTEEIMKKIELEFEALKQKSKKTVK